MYKAAINIKLSDWVKPEYLFTDLIELRHAGSFGEAWNHDANL